MTATARDDVASSAELDDLDWVEHAIVEFLQTSLPDANGVAISGLHRIGGGNSRENWLFDASWTAGRADVRQQLILRRDPPAGLLDTDRRQECAVLEAVAATGLPVPRVRWHDLDGRWLGRPSIVMDRYPGIADRKGLTEENGLGLDAAQRTALARELCRFLARLHAADVDTSSLAQPASATAAESVLDEWEARVQAVVLEPQPDLYFVLGWLRAHLPAPARSALVHGDFRPGNALVLDGRLQVVLDWETAHLGDPLEDLGWHFAPYYRREHFIPGAWEAADFLAEYGRITDMEVDRASLDFWIVVAHFKMCVMALAGIEAFCSGSTDRVTSPTPRLYRQLVDHVQRVESARS